MSIFIEKDLSKETLWRAIILFGRNVATYKFALGKALLDLVSKEKTFIKLDELAEPFSHYICEHLKLTDKQGISSQSRFLDACRSFNKGDIEQDQLITETVSRGFTNVIDAFHIVNRDEVPKRFFIDERKERKGIVITDDLLTLKEKIQFQNFPFEVEARWRLVETAWSLNISPALLEVKFDSDKNLLFAENEAARRINITSCRDSLNGYQKGKCFYCFRDIIIDYTDLDYMADVDHFFPHVLTQEYPTLNINGIWNLVLACRECNRGINGKFSRVPTIHLLSRLYKRNEFFIQSHHPLRETLMNQTGKTLEDRLEYLQKMDTLAMNMLIHRWEPQSEDDPTF